MPDPRQYVRPGQRLQIAASQINALNQMMRVDTGFRAGPHAFPEPAPNVVLIKNVSGQDVPMCGVLGISGVEINPSGGNLTGNTDADKRAREFVSRPVLTGVTPLSSTHGWSIVVTLEPIANDKIGRAAVSGAFACKVFVAPESVGARYATIKDGDITQLAAATCGPIFLAWKEGGNGSGKWAVGVL